MKSEDTVIPRPLMESDNAYERRVRQSEISFKAGYKQGVDDANKCGRMDRLEGIKEVIEWIMSHQDGMMAGQDVQLAAGNECKYGNTSHLLVRWLDWQSKLKEWNREDL